MRILASLLTLIFISACSSTIRTADVHAQGLSFAKPESVGLSSTQLATIDQVLKEYIADDQLVGAVSMVARKGKVVHFENFGDLNKESGADMEKDSLFRIYSMSKPITTVAAMMLYEQGKFQLTDPVEKYLPEFKNILVLENGTPVKQNKTFTIQMLMSHTAGFTYGVFGNTPVDQQYRKAGILGNKDLAEMVTELSKIPLQNQPGTQWHYSVSTDILGRLVEVISVQAFDEYLAQHIFQPLGMNDTFFQVPQDKLNRFGTNHRYNPQTKKLEVSEGVTDSPYVKDVTFFSGGGGLVSSAEDYMKFSQMLLNGGEFNGQRILGRKTIQYMARDHLNGLTANVSGEGLANRPGAGFGLGFGILNDAALSGVIGSEGEYYWGGAAGTIFWIDPVEELIAIVMIQHMNVQIPLRNTIKAITYSAITK